MIRESIGLEFCGCLDKISLLGGATVSHLLVFGVSKITSNYNGDQVGSN